MTTIDNSEHVLTESNYKVIWDCLGKIEEAVPGVQFILKSTKVDASLFPKLTEYPYQIYITSTFSAQCFVVNDVLSSLPCWINLGNNCSYN